MKWLLRGLVGVLALLALGAVAIWALLPAERIAQEAAARATALLGREVRVDGPVSARLLPVPGASLSGVTLANMEGGEAEAMARIETVHAGVALWPLLSGRVEIARLELDGAEIALEIAPDGRPNWSFGRARPAR
ncbi:MAG: AsmA family protein, partial [Pseudomonadota bacterium]